MTKDITYCTNCIRRITCTRRVGMTKTEKGIISEWSEALEYCSQGKPMPIQKMFEQNELIKAFRDKFLERRAIGLLEIEELIKELYE